MSVFAAMASAISPSSSAERKPRHQTGAGQLAARAGSLAASRPGRPMPEEVEGGVSQVQPGSSAAAASRAARREVASAMSLLSSLLPRGGDLRPAGGGDRLHGMH